jgi:hypothetical protein
MKNPKKELNMSLSPETDSMHQWTKVYRACSQVLNLLSEPDPAAVPFMDGMSDALIWPDECPDDAPMEWISGLRLIWNHRTSLLLGHDSIFEEYWRVAKECFPDWVGFRPERNTPSPELLESIREGTARLNEMFNEFEAELARKEAELERGDGGKLQVEDQEEQWLDSDAPHPHEVIRSHYQRMEMDFHEIDGMIVTQVILENLEVEVLALGEPDALVQIVVKFPVRASRKYRAATGEFLHRLNYGARRKFWELDHNDGEIRMSAYTDTMAGPLEEPIFCGLLNCMLVTADGIFPLLTNVLSGSMRPDFAADQAGAVCIAMCDEYGKSEEE